MSKVGILSMQRIKNYGSFLQAYALKSIVKEFGHEVQFVDYEVEKPIISQSNKRSTIKKGFDTLNGRGKIFHKLQYIIHKHNFGKKYYEKLNLTKEMNYTPKLDTLIIGSDEVFNCIQQNENVGYSLQLFGKQNKAKKVITYAASFGNTTLEKLKEYNKSKEIGRLLSKINTISVRDQNSKKIVQTLTSKQPFYHLDPVLIYDYMNKDLVHQIKKKEEYLILYAYSGRISADEDKYIKRFAKKNKLKIYAIGGVQNCANKFIDCTPFEVLSYFDNAKFVITDTFHGSIFSIITQKKFITLVRKSFGNSYGNEEKLIDLLSRLDLNDRIVSDLSSVDLQLKLNEEINYKNVNNIIEEERKKTYDYLRREL